jgi:hypothetical protein
MKYDEVLLIHMGGLGDMCLSESTFLSLSQHFQKNISALGYPRFFNFFRGYFKTIYSIESAKWLYLFSNNQPETSWKRIIFIGKDRNGELRERWQTISEERLIFIDRQKILNLKLNTQNSTLLCISKTTNSCNSYNTASGR